MSPDEAELVDALKSGDKRAFVEIRRRFISQLYRYACRLLRDPGRAEDAVQEAFLALWTKSHLLDRDGNLRSWLYRVVYTKSVDWMRKERETLVEDGLGPREIPNEDPFEHKVVLEQIELALQKLSLRERSAILLFHLEGLTLLELGRAMDLSEDAAESLLRRARLSLRKNYPVTQGDEV